ncbi:MAG: MoxR-like ATPase [Myxococcota bacterium]|jgi:MoxR-like ATPase
MSSSASIQRPLPEHRYADQLRALVLADEANNGRPRPPGWRLSPRAVADFIVGLDEPLPLPDGGSVEIDRKFYGDDPLVERAVVTLTTMRGLMLIGEPGTAKSMLSELLAVAVCGSSTLTIQGSAAATEDQIRYGWNYATLMAHGPVPEALVPAPLYVAMREGRIVRFEEITRCPPEVQDVLLSPLSERLLFIPELEGQPEGMVAARPGFNVIATANTRDRGVNDMSAALKRRFNFETVRPIQSAALELALVKRQTDAALAEVGVPVTLERDVASLLVTTFQELRAGVTAEGERLEKPSTPMSTAEAVAVAISSGMHAYYFGDQKITADHVVRHLGGAALKDDPDDRKRLNGYFDRVVRRRAKDDPLWAAWHDARRWLS